MSSVPKPIKFLKNHYAILKEIYEKKTLELNTNQVIYRPFQQVQATLYFSID